MRVIQVIDLKNGLAVHAVRGQRDQYQPVQSSFSPVGSPLEIARGFYTKQGCTELYVADLDAMEQRGQNLKLVSQMASELGLQILLEPVRPICQ